MFAITAAKGFQITFANGWTASVQFGAGNYCSNRDTDFAQPAQPSPTAEIAAFKTLHGRDVWHDFGGDEVAGWCPPERVLAFLNEVAAKP